MSDACKIERPHSLAFVIYLVVTAVVCGAMVMVIEVLGSRVIGPFFGASLFVWTSLITVTLVALAIGYAAGGILSDRKSSPDALYAIIMAAGFAVLSIPLSTRFVLKSCLPLGLRSGALVSSSILFGPSLLLLGCVSPYIIKIAIREMKNIGRTVGIFYAVSTIGSFAGTVLTGFFLIGYFGVNRIFHIVGIMLIALSVFYFLTFKRRWYLTAVLLVPLLLIHPDTSGSGMLADGRTYTEILNMDTFYGRLKVTDYTSDQDHVRELVIDGLVQGGIDMKNSMSTCKYSYLMELLPYSLNPEGKNCLVVGLGAGVVPMWYEKMGIRADVVDINPEVVSIAKEYFGFNISGDISTSDARYYLVESQKKYDYIIMDVFNGDTTPGHMLSLEAMKLVRERMTAKGILAVNLIGSVGDEAFMTASVIRTIEKIFKTVDVYLTFSAEDRDDYGNIAIIAYNFPAEDFNRKLLTKFQLHPLVRDRIDLVLGKKFILPEHAPAIILSDNYNPIDFFDNGLKEKLRKDILRSKDNDMLL